MCMQALQLAYTEWGKTIEARTGYVAQQLTVLPSCVVKYGFQGNCKKPSLVQTASMLDGPVTLIFFSFTLLRWGSNRLARMI